jgi:hypothetical protein
MLVAPPTFVKRDGVQYRIDGVSGNFVFLWSQHNSGFVVDVRGGSLIAKNYHPVTLASFTFRSKEVLEGMLGKGHPQYPHQFTGAEHHDMETVRLIKTGSTRLGKLLELDVPCSAIPYGYMPIIDAMLRKVPAKEFSQGIKSLYDFEIPKVVVNYLSGGYIMPYPLEGLLRLVMGERALRPGVDDELVELDSMVREGDSH